MDFKFNYKPLPEITNEELLNLGFRVYRENNMDNDPSHDFLDGFLCASKLYINKYSQIYKTIMETISETYK